MKLFRLFFALRNKSIYYVFFSFKFLWLLFVCARISVHQSIRMLLAQSQSFPLRPKRHTLWFKFCAPIDRATCLAQLIPFEWILNNNILHFLNRIYSIFLLKKNHKNINKSKNETKKQTQEQWKTLRIRIRK